MLMNAQDDFWEANHKGGGQTLVARIRRPAKRERPTVRNAKRARDPASREKAAGETSGLGWRRPHDGFRPGNYTAQDGQSLDGVVLDASTLLRLVRVGRLQA